MGPTLFVAAMERELRSLRQRMEKCVPIRSLNAWIGELDDTSVVTAWTGDGAQRARRGLDRLIAHFSPEQVVVIGVAGGLSPGLAVGSLVTVTAIHGDTLGIPPVNQKRAIPVTLCSSDAMMLAPDEKAGLWRRCGKPDPAIVDLESASYVDVARRRGVPIRVVKVISDADRDCLPAFLNEAVDSEGSIQPGKVVKLALKHPRAWPKLRSLQKTVHQASRRLASVASEIM
ncbi:MAG: hypothetical protein AAFZ38_04370 [Myxococcota bacterium]